MIHLNGLQYETHVLGSFIADFDTNSNPVAVKVDDKGDLMSRLVCRRDSSKWNRMLLYVKKDRSACLEELKTVAFNAIKVT